MPGSFSGLSFGGRNFTYYIMDTVNPLECLIGKSMVTIASNPGTTANQDTSCLYYNGLIYQGFGTNGASYIASLNSYNPLTNSWTSRQAAPVGLQQPFFGVCNNKFYACNGENTATTDSNAVYEYNPVSNTWLTKGNTSPLSVERAGGCVWRNVIYMLGGIDTSSSTVHQELYAYDPIPDRWTLVGNYPLAGGIQSVTPIVVGNNMYVLGGSSGGSSITNCYRYSFLANTWTPIRSLTTALQDSGITYLNGKIFLNAGNLNQTENGNSQYYDIATNTFIKNVVNNSASTLFGTNLGVIAPIPKFAGG